MTTTRSYDFLNRLTQVASVGGAGSPLSSFTYTYNNANQRTRVTLADGSYWLYAYDALGQVISGKRYWADGTPVAGQQFEYAFDHIGNRRSTRAGGDSSGASLRLAFYTNNLLNQITGRTVPGYVDLVGTAHTNATVTVWSGSDRWVQAERKGAYWRADLAVDNTVGLVGLGLGGSLALQELPLPNVAALRDGSNPDRVVTETGHLFVPRTPESFLYDADGNLLRDGLWIYTWDAENRLVRVQSRPDTPPASWRRVEWQYDGLGRRIRQTTSVWTNGTWQVTEDLKLISDLVLFGRHIAELNATNNALVRSYVWGLDLSGSLDGAGGVGGLLFVTQHSTPQPPTHFVAYDGNGNVVGLVSASTGSETARYEYGPFGELIRASGPMARFNPFRSSTKYQDDETDLLYYGYRHYNPSTGRWPNRDPIGELAHVQTRLQQVDERQLRDLLHSSHEAWIALRQDLRRQATLPNDLKRMLYAPASQKAFTATPYGFVHNNPVMNIDPNGEWLVAGLTIVTACCVGKQIYDGAMLMDGTAERSWWVHCLVACRVARRCLGLFVGTAATYWYGVPHEWMRPSADREEDLEAFAYGGTYAAMDGARSCESACSTAYPYGPGDTGGH